MLRTNYPETSASCTNCKRLNDCMLKGDILSDIEVPDFAKEGCLKYKGEGEQKLFLPKEDVLQAIKQGPIFKANLRELGLNEPRLRLTLDALGIKVKEDAEKWVFVSQKKVKSTIRKHRGTPILMCDKDGKMIRRFKMIKDAVKHLGLEGGTSIAQSLRVGCLAYGYLWVRENEY